MTGIHGTEEGSPETVEVTRSVADCIPVWMWACVVILLAAVLVVGGLVVHRLLTRDLVAARARDARLQVFEGEATARSGDLNALLRLAYAYQQAALYRQALREYKKVLSVDSGNATALYNTGIIQLTLGKDKAGEETLSRLLRLRPEHAFAAYALAKHYTDKGDYERALAIAAPAADAHPEDAQMQFLAGLSFEHTGRVKEATARFRAALQLVPDMAEAKSALERLRAAQ